MTASIFIGISVDGFIARPNGDLDWLPEGGGESHGYDEFMASVDALVMGRHSFEKVLTFGAWPYGSKRVVVLSSRPVDLSDVSEGVVELMAGTPAEIVSRLAATGAHHHLHRRRANDTIIFTGGAYSTPHHHSRARPYWIRHSTVRIFTARCPLASRSYQTLPERLGASEYTVIV